MEPISFIIPSRNNLSYLKMCYDSIRKNAGYIHEICFADDASTDGTWEWLEEISKKDNLVKIYRNVGPEREGLTILYDFLVDNVATTDKLLFFHSDMYLMPEAVEQIDRYLKDGVVVSLTRVEPPLHPSGVEKITKDFGIEPEELKEQELLDWYNRYKPEQETTEGIFAPWAITRDDFESVGGHDKLFRPQSKEDSDIFNRLQLNGVKFIQTWKGLVYHMTCRGSRFNPMAGGGVGKDSPEWVYTTTKNMREFIRKWGQMVEHDEYMKPTITPKYNIGFRLTEVCDINLLRELEPWCSNLYVDDIELITKYIDEEQINTDYDLKDKLLKPDVENDTMVEFNPKLLNSQNFKILVQLPKILQDSGKLGEFQLEIFNIFISSLKTYEKELISAV
tara:strand:- start:1563 stop:2738 length:1176 start_codon:yes stop_codon:yes gene_type:complete